MLRAVPVNSRSTISVSADLLNVLQCAKASELVRKPTTDCNPPKGKKRSRSEGVSNPRSVAPRQRVREFPMNLSQCRSNGKLHVLSSVSGGALIKKVSCESAHLQSVKHMQIKAKSG